MIAQEIRKYDMLRRVQDFLVTWAAKLGAINSTTAKQELDALTQEMAASETEQATSTLAAKGETAKLATLRADLMKHHMRPVATIAAAHLRDVPNFHALQLPSKDVKLAKLVQDAIAMADAARPHSQVFVQSGRPADFADVHSGQAIFVARVNGQLVGRPLPIPLPQYAFQVDPETQQRTPCIVVQAEEANNRQIIGGRRVPDGQELVGFIDDFELLGSSPPAAG